MKTRREARVAGTRPSTGEDAQGDEALVALAVAGEGGALEQLLRRQQAWIYNLALRMLQDRPDAEDATQECLLRIASRLAAFRGESRFRTWAYRLACNLLLDSRRSRPELAVHDFACYGDYLDNAPDAELSEEYGSSVERAALIEEARLSCLAGMLLCLDREQRLAFLLGEVFEISDRVAGEVLSISPDNFRQRLTRARRDLREFLLRRCGLVAPGNPCRCARKTQAFVRAGIVDRQQRVFSQAHAQRVRDVVRHGLRVFSSLVEETNTRLYRDHPWIDPPDLVARLRATLAGAPLRTLLELD